MILEIATLQIKPGQTAAFEQAFAQAQRIIAAMPNTKSGARCCTISTILFRRCCTTAPSRRH